MDDRLTAWKTRIVDFGLFILFVVGFVTFIIYEVTNLLRPFFQR